MSGDHTVFIGNCTADVNGVLTDSDKKAFRYSYRIMALPDVLARIDERLAVLNMTPNAASVAAKKPDSIRNMRRAVDKGGRQGVSTATIDALAPVLKTTSNWLLNGTGPSEVTVTEDGAYRAPPEFLGERDLPVYAAVEGGLGEMVISTEALELVPRPWYLARVKEAYAVLVTGESMRPAFRPGEMALVNPKLPPIREKEAIFIASLDGGDWRATIKEFVRATATEFVVVQFNPYREIRLKRSEWQQAFRVVGKYSGG